MRRPSARRGCRGVPMRWPWISTVWPWRRARSTVSPSSKASSRLLALANGGSRLSRERPERHLADAVLEHSSRRGFLELAGAALIGLAGSRSVARLVLADDALAYTNFCGHTYTTGNCPHPTGLPRGDPPDYPLPPRHGP